MTSPARAAAQTRLPAAPALGVGVREAAWLPVDGPVEMLTLPAAARRIAAGASPIVCHASAVARRLALSRLRAFDVLELFAFVRPARFCVPSPRGLATVLLLPLPATLADEAATLIAISRALLAELTASPRPDAAAVAQAMAQGGWPWSDAVLSAVGAEPAAHGGRFVEGLRVWRRLPDFEETPPQPPADNWPVEAVEARARLVQLLGARAEARPQQMQYASHVASAFAPRERVGEPRVVLAEAGTGIGKTVGYIAAATLWARKNRGSVWISTFTRNLQRQLDRELDRAYPRLADKAANVVVRKGRENLFCLLNYEEAVNAFAVRLEASDAAALGLIARWALATRDGDMIGGDFPAWLADLLGPRLTLQLTDTRGECIYSACPHFRRCFVERAIRKARSAEIVVANHALVMVHAARGAEDGSLPTRYVFDEAHHLFEAADSAFSIVLSGLETAELRRWLRGAEGGGRSRRRGLQERVEGLFVDTPDALAALELLTQAATALPGPGWRQRLATGAPLGPTEALLAVVRAQVHARNQDTASAYSLEASLRPPAPGLIEAGEALDRALMRFARPLQVLIRTLTERLDAEAATLDGETRRRIEGVRRGILRRACEPIAGWRAVLQTIGAATPEEFVDWLQIERIEGRDFDVGLCRHWLDPTRPLAAAVLVPAHGVVITSATLRDATGDEDSDWAWAQARTGVGHLASRPLLSSLPSPFDYRGQTRILIVNDVSRDDMRQVAAAYRELFLAAGGGGLGLFTAISRLRTVYDAIAAALEDAGIRLLAQHVDALDLGSLVDVFRAEETSCLLGTDAVRDGVDVPGRSLRLIVFDRVPWPRPTVLHRARRHAFGGRAYDEALVRARLKQAFGRLIRRADDRGVFVMLDRGLPSRLLTAFPPDVRIERLGLKEAIAATRAALEGTGSGPRG